MKPDRWLIVLVSVAAFLGLGSANWAAGWTDSLLGKDLDSLVGKQLGLTSDQSKGGIGAILGLAKEKLTSADFDKIAAAIPGADKYVAKAKKLGLLDKPVGNKEGLNGAFSKLGIPQDKASQMVPTVTDIMGKMGGDEVKKMISSVLG